jgi:hypothetical protein
LERARYRVRIRGWIRNRNRIRVKIRDWIRNRIRVRLTFFIIYLGIS